MIYRILSGGKSFMSTFLFPGTDVSGDARCLGEDEKNLATCLLDPGCLRGIHGRGDPSGNRLAVVVAMTP